MFDDRRLKLKEIATWVGLAVKTMFRIIYEKLHIAKASARCVPRILPSVQKEHRVTCSRKLLELCHGNGKKVLESIVTGDETHGPLLRSSFQKRIDGMAQTRKSATEKSQGDSVDQEDHGNNLLVLPRDYLGRL